MPQEMLTWPERTPEDVLDYSINWSPWLKGDTINASVWAVSADDMTVENTSFTTTATMCWLHGGTETKTYYVSNHITTVSGRQKTRTVSIAVTGTFEA